MWGTQRCAWHFVWMQWVRRSGELYLDRRPVQTTATDSFRDTAHPQRNTHTMQNNTLSAARNALRVYCVHYTLHYTLVSCMNAAFKCARVHKYFKWGEERKKSEGRRCTFYVGHVFIYFWNSLPHFPELVYWCHLALQTPPHRKPLSFSLCRNEHLKSNASLPFHITSPISLQPSMWMAKTCKCLEETEKRRGSGWEERGETREVKISERGGAYRRSPNKGNLLFCFICSSILVSSLSFTSFFL